MQDVAARAGVSAKTVSRVFQDEQYGSDEVCNRVNHAMRELNFVPNMLARTFREGRTSVLGIAVPAISDPLFASIIDAAHNLAKTRRQAIAVTSLKDDPANERPIVEALLSRQINRLVLAPSAVTSRVSFPGSPTRRSS